MHGQTGSEFLIVYGSGHGQTARIAERLAAALTTRGHRVTVWKGDQLPAEVRLDGFAACVVAGSVRYGRHQRCLREFARRHSARLNEMPSAFLSVCGALIGSWAEGPEESRKYIARFLDETGWRPPLVRAFAGALAYTRYGPFTRWVMKLISRRTGRPTDTSRDWDFTDWDAVDRLAAELASRFGVRERNLALAG